MVIVAILVGILACGVVIGLVMRPRVRAAQDAFAEQVRALVVRTGWRPDHDPVPPLQATFVTLDDVLGSTSHHGISANLRLAGQWRGVEVRVLQLRYRTANVATVRAATMVLVPRPAPGPSLTVRGGGDTAALAMLPPAVAHHLAADPRMRDRTLFFTAEHLAAVFPGEVIDQDATIATADLLADLTQRLGIR